MEQKPIQRRLLELGVERGGPELVHCRKAHDEALVVTGGRSDLRLLQHDLGDPDAIGRRVGLPGQVPEVRAFEEKKEVVYHEVGGFEPGKHGVFVHFPAGGTRAPMNAGRRRWRWAMTRARRTRRRSELNRVIADYCHKNALPDGRRRVA